MNGGRNNKHPFLICIWEKSGKGRGMFHKLDKIGEWIHWLHSFCVHGLTYFKLVFLVWQWSLFGLHCIGRVLLTQFWFLGNTTRSWRGLMLERCPGLQCGGVQTPHVRPKWSGNCIRLSDWDLKSWFFKSS